MVDIATAANLRRWAGSGFQVVLVGHGSLGHPGSDPDSGFSRPRRARVVEPVGPKRRIRHMRTSAELREGFLAFFEREGHKRLPSWPLIPRADDQSTLLISAGMQPQMPYFLGGEPPPAPLTTTVQKCFRTPDIDEVGLDGHHLTFFEMLGNFSFGQYFKAGAIELAWEFVFDHLQIDPERI